ncbi:MAG: putative membrane protein [Pseudomonas citronellolis]|nr:MAG: putative membrane protein [Pseudomonas citronellolis]
MPWLLLFLLAATLHLFGMTLDLPLLRALCKPLPVLLLWAWLGTQPASVYRRWVRLGLLASAVGDALLEWPFQAFVPGLLAFLLAHLAYLAAYLSDSRRPAWPALGLCALYAGGLFSLLAHHGLGPLTLPVALYSLAISAMLWRALARLGLSSVNTQSARLAALGAVLFVGSDSLIGISRFVTPFTGAGYLVMLSYWAGQAAIARSVRWH